MTTSLKDQILRAAEFDWQRITGDHDIDTISARSGAQQESVRLTPLITLLVECASALEFYARPESIERYLKEVKIPGTNNTRPSINMDFYSKARSDLAKLQAYLKERK